MHMFFEIFFLSIVQKIFVSSFMKINGLLFFIFAGGSTKSDANSRSGDIWMLRRPFLKRNDYLFDLGLEFVTPGDFAGDSGPLEKNIIVEGTYIS